MNIGMLWFDNDAKENFDTKVARAADYYQKKYGKSPTLCFVHPSMLPVKNSTNNGNNGTTSKQDKQKPYFAGRVEVRSNQSVLPNHFWIGVNGIA